MQCVLRYPETNWVFVSGALHWTAPRNVMSDEIILVLIEISLFGNVDAESSLCSNLRHKTQKKTLDFLYYSIACFFFFIFI